MGVDTPVGSGTKRKSSESPKERLSKVRTANPTKDNTREFFNHLAWLECTVAVERAKKLTVSSAEGMTEKLSLLRGLYLDLNAEANRLFGANQEQESSIKDIVSVFSEKLKDKDEEIRKLKTEIDTLKSSRSDKNQPKSFAEVAKKSAPKPDISKTPGTVTTAKPVPKGKSIKKLLQKGRDSKTSPLFVLKIDDPSQDLDKARKEVWSEVMNKTKAPRARTIKGAHSITIIPDDSNTLEVLRQTSGLLEVGPRRPRCIIYDVEVDISAEQLADQIQAQNPELGLSTNDTASIKPLFKLGPRDRHSTHWVIESDPETFKKLENRKVFLGMSRCSIKLHMKGTQCYKCQKYGHTALKCRAQAAVCRNCAGSHDSRSCDNATVKCSNCGGGHKASYTKCRAKTAAIVQSMRRTDFGTPHD
jgi:hypothetical protein